jgi:DNA polymerase III alpha subunit (gram-positive type)
MKSDLIYITYDTETTGLNPSKNAVCEIAMCVMDNELNDIGEYSSGIIKPIEGREMSQGALNANGITQEQLNEGRDGKVVAKEVVTFIKSFKKQKSKVVLCGHNIIKFDNPFLYEFLNEYGYDLGGLVNDEFFIDTLFLSRVKYLESSNYKLGTICQKNNITLVDAHRALADTKANKELVKKFIISLRGEGGVQVIEEERPRVTFQF